MKPSVKHQPIPFGFLIAAVVLCFPSCNGPLKQADLQTFVETGETNVLLRSETFSPSLASLNRISSATTVTCSLAIINPKSFDVTYSLGWGVDNSLFATQPSASPVPSDPTHLSFSFVLADPLAEHKTITFNVGKYVASINKTYAPETFSVICDSPPDPAARLSAVVNPSDQKSVLAILLPRQPSDDDLSQLQITWTEEGSSSSNTAIYSISSLNTPPSPCPFSGTYACYFQSSDTVAGYGYTYSVVVIDQAGQVSSPVSSTSQANFFPVNYDGNGATGGSAPASVSYRLGATVTVVGPGNLSRTDYVFNGWSTTPTGPVAYAPSATFTLPANEITLYAQWYTTGITVSFDLSPQGLAFNPSVLNVNMGDTVNVRCTNTTLQGVQSGWTWYLDGNSLPFSAQTASSLSIDTTQVSTLTVGNHIVSCTVMYNGLLYSGYFLLTISQ